jgi:hypothetical protein
MEHGGYVEKGVYGAQTKGVNRRVIAIKEQPDLHYRPARYQCSGVPHFQTVRAGCTEGHGRALRIQIRSAQGTTRQAKARALSLRWAWIFGLGGRGWSATATSGDITLVWARVGLLDLEIRSPIASV